MVQLFSRILDRLNTTQRTRQIIVNLGFFIAALIAFIGDNPIFHLPDEPMKWLMVLSFLANAVAGIVTVPMRQVPVGYNLIYDGGDNYRLVKDATTNWLGAILSALKATDQIKTILVNLGVSIGLILTLLIDSAIIPADLPQVLSGVAFIGNALAGMLNVPNRSIPDGWELYLDTQSNTFKIRREQAGDDPTLATRAVGAGSEIVFKF